MIKKLAWVFGIVFLLAAVLRFMQGDDHMLYGLHVDSRHNLVHLVTGIGFLVTALAGENYARMFFQIFGVVYGLVAVAGFALGELPGLGITLNQAGNVFHLVVSLACLLIGFVLAKRPL